jgi:hypothetical protein
MLSTFPISSLSLDLTFLSIILSHGIAESWAIFADIVRPAYVGILVSKSGYSFVIVVLLSRYSGVSNVDAGGSFSPSNFDFISSFVSETQR